MYQKKVWGRNNTYTRALNVECPTVIKDQIEQMITRVTMNEDFKKIFPEAMLIPHSKKALNAFQIDSENFIRMKNSILHATTKFSLYNLTDIDIVKEMDDKTVREYILDKTPKLRDRKSVILHITEGIEKEETVFTFESVIHE